MNEIIINFAPLSDQELLDLAAKVNLALSKEPCTRYFPEIKPAPEKLVNDISNFAGALAEETSKSITALRKAMREILEETLTKLAGFLGIEANGDVMKLAATGFELKKKPTRTGAATGIPENLRLLTTGISGEILARCNRVPGARSYHAQYALSPDGPWIDIDPVTASQQIHFTGLQRGKDIYIRVRAFGANGYSGWSDIATIMVV